MPKDDKSQSPSPPPKSLISSFKEHHVSPAKPRSSLRSSELSIKRARSWSPRRDRSFSPRRRNSETFRDTGHAGREYDDRRLHVANLDKETSKKGMFDDPRMMQKVVKKEQSVMLDSCQDITNIVL